MKEIRSTKPLIIIVIVLWSLGGAMIWYGHHLKVIFAYQVRQRDIADSLRYNVEHSQIKK